MRTLAIILSVAVYAIQPAAADIAVGQPVPVLDGATTETGAAFDLSSLRGQWVVLTLGASWCKPCAAELPAWDELAKTLKSKEPFQFVAINLDNDKKKGKAFFKKLKVKVLRRIYMPADGSKAADALATGTFPSTFVIDPTGVIRHIHKGYEKGDAAKLRAVLMGLASAASAPAP